MKTTTTTTTTEDQGRTSLRSRCTVNNVEFNFIKVPVRYIQYIAYKTCATFVFCFNLSSSCDIGEPGRGSAPLSFLGS